jgi:hypothetical protein
MQYVARRYKDMKEQREIFTHDLLQHLVMSNTKYSVESSAVEAVARKQLVKTVID